MIKAFHEAPKSIFHQVQSRTAGDYALVNLLDDEEYFNLFTPKTRETILDNSVFELGTAFDADVFASWVEKFQPTYYIVPDVLENSEETIESFFRFIETYKGLPGKIMGVAQGETYKDFIKCYKAIAPHCAKIGISFDASWYKTMVGNVRIRDGVDPGLQRLAIGRQQTLLRMMSEGVLQHKPHHLLGVALPQELKGYNYWQQAGILRCIDSVDTSNPVVHGLKGIRYTAAGLSDKVSQKLYTMIDAEVSEQQRADILYNIEQFGRFANAKLV